MKKILIIGATSGIVIACARLWAAQKADFFLVARNEEKLKQVANDLLARGATTVNTFVMDANDFDKHLPMLKQAYATLGVVDIALLGYGTLSDQAACNKHVDVALHELTTNCLSPVSLLTELSHHLIAQKNGTIAVISSVAGDRGRAKLAIYGSAKAFLTSYCSALRNRLCKYGVHVITIIPGYVATPMTEGLESRLIPIATPEKAAHDIVRAIDKKKDVLYTPWFWRYIMLIIKLIPEKIFKRLDL